MALTEAEVAKLKTDFEMQLRERDDKLAEQNELYQKLWEKVTNPTEDNLSPPVSPKSTYETSKTTPLAKEIKAAMDDGATLQKQWQVAGAELMMSLSARLTKLAGYSRLNSLLIHKLMGIPARGENENAGMYGYRFCMWIVDKLKEVLKSCDISRNNA